MHVLMQVSIYVDHQLYSTSLETIYVIKLYLGSPCSENLCSNTGQNYSRMGGCDDLVDLVLCGGSASVPRGVVTRFIPVSPLVTDINCFDGQLVDDIGPSPVCDSDIPDTLYM